MQEEEGFAKARLLGNDYVRMLAAVELLTWIMYHHHRQEGPSPVEVDPHASNPSEAKPRGFLHEAIGT